VGCGNGSNRKIMKYKVLIVIPHHHSVSHVHKKVTEANRMTNDARF
jgi:hypothetical protein